MNCTNLLSHFEPFKQRLIESKIKFKTPNKPYYYLHRERKEQFFKAGTLRIITQARALEPIFVCTEENCYPSRALFVITSLKFNIKYLCGLLNSKLVKFWLKNKGKMQGACFQVDKGPLLSIPIKEREPYHQKIIECVDSLLLNNSVHDSCVKIIEQIDKYVYKSYRLSYDEILIVDPETPITREEYEDYK